jgi:Rha family phage regulatory protein
LFLLIRAASSRLRPPAGHAFADSRDVAATFGKQHGNVLQSIRNLNCSDDFSRLNFQFAVFLDEQEKQRPCYEMTRDGFTRLPSCQRISASKAR